MEEAIDLLYCWAGRLLLEPNPGPTESGGLVLEVMIAPGPMAEGGGI